MVNLEFDSVTLPAASSRWERPGLTAQQSMQQPQSPPAFTQQVQFPSQMNQQILQPQFQQPMMNPQMPMLQQVPQFQSVQFPVSQQQQPVLLTNNQPVDRLLTQFNSWRQQVSIENPLAADTTERIATVAQSERKLASTVSDTLASAADLFLDFMFNSVTDPFATM
jgi:hypothetical protein